MLRSGTFSKFWQMMSISPTHRSSASPEMNADANELNLPPVTFVNPRGNQATFPYAVAQNWAVISPELAESPMMTELS